MVAAKERAHPLTLNTIPAEVLQHIAYYVATHELKGPPSDLVRLCRTSRSIHASLSLDSNPALYASIFRFKFDTSAALRRVQPEHLTAPSLAAELRNRFEGLKRIRAGIGSHAAATTDRQKDLWMAIFLMLENDGKNTVQLKRFAFVEQWLFDFFLEHSGGSFASFDTHLESWPRDNEDNRLAMWLLWLCDEDTMSLNYSTTTRRMWTEILRAYAIAANKYPLTIHTWSEFNNPCTFTTTSRTPYTHYGFSFIPVPPSISLSGILSYMCRLNELGRPYLSSEQQDMDSEGIEHCLSTPGESEEPRSRSNISLSWDCDWERCVTLSLEPGPENRVDNRLSRFYRPGSLEGIWEGLFTYTEFSVYASILGGASPQALHEGSVGQNLQIWKLREYHLYSDSSRATEGLLPPGQAFDAFFPSMTIDEGNDSVIMVHNSRATKYTRYTKTASPADSSKKLRDVIVFGEGHSSWGDFQLRGRMRASDTFMTVMKQYYGVESRARWLYRGYLIGGRMVGRWRDALTPLQQDGYEGAFELSRRT